MKQTMMSNTPGTPTCTPTIVFIITKLELGGAQKVVLNLFHGLIQTGHTVHLISSTQGILADEVKTYPTVHLLPELQREISFFTPWREWAAGKAIVRTLRDIARAHDGPIVVHTHSTKAGLVGRWAAWWAGIPVRVHTVHGFGFHAHQGWFGWLATYLLELITMPVTTHNICVSQADKNTGASLLPGFKPKSSIIRASVDPQHFQAARTTGHMRHHDQPFVIGTISCFKPQKNLIDLLRAFAWVYTHNPQVRLEIIGDGVQRPLLEQFIAQHHLQQVVTLHGWQSDVTPFLHTWHVFTLSSLWEGLPCSVIEARLARLPVVSYKTGGIGEVIFHGVNGLLYPQGSWERLAQGLLQLSADEGLYAQLTHYPDTLKEFTADNMVKKHASLYGSLCAPRNTVSPK